MKKTLFATLGLAMLASTIMPISAHAVGTVTGAAGGAVAGKMMGGHTKTGAVAGGLVGHHHHAKALKARK